MKIGVALSGCSTGGVGAYAVLDWMREEGLAIEMLCACGVPAVPALVYASGLPCSAGKAILQEFLLDWRNTDISEALAGLSAKLPAGSGDRIHGLALCAYDIAEGKAIVYTNDLAFETDTLITYPLTGLYKALCASVGAAGGFFGAQSVEETCDFALQYGCPYPPLRLAGCERIFSFSFMPLMPESAYDISLDRRIIASSCAASHHEALRFPPSGKKPAYAAYADIAASRLKNCRKALIFSSVL